MDREIASAKRKTDEEFKKLIKEDKKHDRKCERDAKMAHKKAMSEKGREVLKKRKK